MQLVCPSCHPDVPRWKPDLTSNLENNLFDAGELRLMGLSLLQVLTEGLVSLLQASYDSVCLDFRIRTRWFLRGLKLHHRMVVVIRPEWSDPHRRVYCVIVRGFG